MRRGRKSARSPARAARKRGPAKRKALGRGSARKRVRRTPRKHR
jgi:hypothetical protein